MNKRIFVSILTICTILFAGTLDAAEKSPSSFEGFMSKVRTLIRRQPETPPPSSPQPTVETPTSVQSKAASAESMTVKKEELQSPVRKGPVISEPPVFYSMPNPCTYQSATTPPSTFIFQNSSFNIGGYYPIMPGKIANLDCDYSATITQCETILYKDDPNDVIGSVPAINDDTQLDTFACPILSTMALKSFGGSNEQALFQVQAQVAPGGTSGGVTYPNGLVNITMIGYPQTQAPSFSYFSSSDQGNAAVITGKVRRMMGYGLANNPCELCRAEFEVYDNIGQTTGEYAYIMVNRVPGTQDVNHCNSLNRSLSMNNVITVHGTVDEWNNGPSGLFPLFIGPFPTQCQP